MKDVKKYEALVNPYIDSNFVDPKLIPDILKEFKKTFKEAYEELFEERRKEW